MNILYIEDDELNRQILTTKLLKSGHNIDVAVDGFEKAKLGSYEIIFMDLSIPRI